MLAVLRLELPELCLEILDLLTLIEHDSMRQIELMCD